MKEKFGIVCAELVAVFDNTEDEIMNSIPKKFKDYIYENADNNYNVNLDLSKDLNSQDISSDTKALLALIFRDFVCEKDEKTRLINLENEIQQKRQEELKQKYSNVNIFDNKKELEEAKKELIVIEEKGFKKLLNKIISFFGKFKKS